MADIQSVTAEIRRGKKEEEKKKKKKKKKEKKKKPQDENIMVCPILTKPRFGHLLRPPAWKQSGTIVVERERTDKRRK